MKWWQEPPKRCARKPGIPGWPNPHYEREDDDPPNCTPATYAAPGVPEISVSLGLFGRCGPLKHLPPPSSLSSDALRFAGVRGVSGMPKTLLLGRSGKACEGSTRSSSARRPCPVGWAFGVWPLLSHTYFQVTPCRPGNRMPLVQCRTSKDIVLSYRRTPAGISQSNGQSLRSSGQFFMGL